MQKQVDTPQKSVGISALAGHAVKKLKSRRAATHVNPALMLDYCLDRDALSPRETAKVEGHLRICEPCRKEAETGADDYFKRQPSPCD